jgi:ligand-binding sensor domain-containing protein
MRKRIIIASLWFLSCGHAMSTKPSATQETNRPLGDPNFVVARDIISTQGPHSITRNLLRDQHGNLWFATWEGIVRYDGSLFTNVTLKEGLRRFRVFSVLEDTTGSLWFGTIGGGVYRYDGKSFTLFTTADGLASNVVTCMLKDKAGNIWFGTDHGVSRYNGRSFTNFTTRDGLSANSVNAIAQDKSGKLWFGTLGGVSCYDGKSMAEFTNTDKRSVRNVRSIIEDKAGDIWIGGQDGLDHYDGTLLTRLRTNFIGYVFEDKAGNLWLSEGESDGSGVTLWRYDGKTFTRIKTDKQIFGIAEDRAGNIWFGTWNGVYRYDGKSVTSFSGIPRPWSQWHQ